MQQHHATEDERLARECSQPLGSAIAFAADRSGNVAIIFAVCFAGLLLLAAGGINYAVYTGAMGSAQRAADAASLAGAKQLSLADSNRVNVPSVVETVVENYLGANFNDRPDMPYSVDTTIVDQSDKPQQVDVKLTISVPAFFGAAARKLMVESVATVVGKPNVCVLTLDPTALGGIYLLNNARIIGSNCGVYVNSTQAQAIIALNNSSLSATVICTAGGKAGSAANYSPQPLTDCPQFDDPLAGLPEPAPGACTASNLVINNQTTTLAEGTYCGGITIKGTSNVTLEPGVYILTNGPLVVQDTAQISGANTGFYFLGMLSGLYFAPDTTISLTAPKSGVLSGILFFGSRSSSSPLFQISSNNAHQLLGTIYLPKSALSINTVQPVADRSAYTVVISSILVADSNTTVVLNTNYDQTDIPVPKGIRGAGMPVELTK